MNSGEEFTIDGVDALSNREYEDWCVVSNPSHYVEGRNIEPIDVIEDWNLDHHEATALAYISRAMRKSDPITDYKKAIWYLQRKISILKSARDI